MGDLQMIGIADMLYGLFNTLFLMPTFYLLLWGIQNHKFEDWK